MAESVARSSAVKSSPPASARACCVPRSRSTSARGIRQRPEAIAAVALQEDVDVVGLSILSGAHVALTRKTADALRAAGAGDVALVVGGTIPEKDVVRLQEAGAAAVYPTGTPLETLVDSIRSL